MDEHPATALRRRSDTSIGVATSLVKHGEADAVVSAATPARRWQRRSGARPEFAASIARALRHVADDERKPPCLLDAGATMDADENNILQFARMASRFMEKVHGVDRTIGRAHQRR